MKKIALILCFLQLAGFAQLPGKEAWRWYFGHKCGVDFSSGTAVGIVGIPNFYTSGGCASISDENTGQYFFSVGNQHIYNRNNSVMNNGFGIKDNPINSQDLIVQQPGHSNIYFVFTPDKAGYSGAGVSYSIVDMNQLGGLGSVILKNKLLIPPPATEKITAVRHCNGRDYWVIAHPANSNAFYSYLLSSLGLDTIPVISNAGLSHQFNHWNGSSYYEGMGVLKASPNGKMLVSVIQSDSLPVMEVFDFNNFTGQVSNPIQFNYLGQFGPYGASFSPDNSKLYCVNYSTTASMDTSYLLQYDLSSGIPAQIISSQILIHKSAPNNGYGYLGELQIAPDGKIYACVYGRDTMAVINNPNGLGAACNYQYPAVVLPNTSMQVWGLPNFIDANRAGIQINLPDIQLCNTFTTSVADAGSGYVNYQWSTGATTQTISISSPGQYWVTVTNAQGCQRTDTIGAYVLIPIKQDTIACDTFSANVIQGGVLQYNWFDGTHLATHHFTQSGNYYVDIAYVNGCGIRDSIKLTLVSSPYVNLGKDTAFCKGDLLLDANCSTCSYQWSTGETSPAITAKTIGTYWVKVLDANGCFGSDTLVVNPQLSAFNFVMPNIVTPNGDNINDEIDFGKYQFSTFSVEIFNRWGQKVFSDDDPNAIWKPGGDEGTYFYTGQYRIDCGVDSRTKEIKGFITVAR